MGSEEMELCTKQIIYTVLPFEYPLAEKPLKNANNIFEPISRMKIA